jgi:4-hydroxy-2-oxoheptanedioate aldolase
VLRRYPLRDLMASGQQAIGTVIAFDSPDVVEFVSAIGFDFIMIDCEHGPMQPDTVLGMIRVAEANGVAPLVRVASQLAHEALRFLDVGAAGIVFPRVESRLQAQDVVAVVKYPPKGIRGVAPAIRAAGYGVTWDFNKYLRQADEETIVVPIIETDPGLAAIDDILSTPGVDAVAIGTVDLAMAMGCDGNTNDPRVAQAVRDIIASCKKHGRPALMAAATLGQLRSAMDVGAAMVMVPFSIWLIQQGQALLKELRSKS